MSLNSQGYTLVELLVAIAVTSIVLAGTYAAYTFFAHQQQVLVAQTEVDRNALRAIDLIQSDIRMAGFTAITEKTSTDVAAVINPARPLSSPAILIANSNPGDITFKYDDYDEFGRPLQTSVRYYLLAAPTGNKRFRLMREWRRCPATTSICDLSLPSTIIGAPEGEPLLDWVSVFSVDKKNINTTSTSFNMMPKTIQVGLKVSASKKFEGSGGDQINKDFTFLTRARNVSLVP